MHFMLVSDSYLPAMRSLSLNLIALESCNTAPAGRANTSDSLSAPRFLSSIIKKSAVEKRPARGFMQYQQYHLCNNEAFILIKGLFIADGKRSNNDGFLTTDNQNSISLPSVFCYTMAPLQRWHTPHGTACHSESCFLAQTRPEISQDWGTSAIFFIHTTY